jgi:drug/metabolite transporter (DMT)-like permease
LLTGTPAANTAAVMSPSVLLAALLAVVVWGASPVGTKFAVAALSPMTVAVLRTCLGALAGLPLALALRVPPPRSRAQFGLLALSSFCGFIGFPMLFSLGMALTTGVHGAMILAFLPALTGLIASLWDRQMPSGRWWLGCALALVGEAILILSRDVGTAGEATIAGDALVWCSAVFASLGYVTGARLKQAGYSSQGATFWGVCLASLAVAPLLPFLLRGLDVASVPASAWAGVLYLAFGVTILGYVLWYWALAKGGIARIGLMQFFMPISGVLLAHLLLRERLSFYLVIASALVLAGVFTANRVPSPAPRSPDRRN